MSRIAALETAHNRSRAEDSVRELPPFFRHAYHPTTLRQIVYLRNALDHRASATDCMIAALVLGSLHGESERSPRFLSNQMPHTISTKPDYSIRFWKKHGYKAPRRDVFSLLREQASYRYESGRPKARGLILHMDMRELPRQRLRLPKPITCAITSPPYFDVTNYGEDQWLRLWFLGGPPRPIRQTFSRDDRHSGLDQYWAMLADMWRSLGLVLGERSDVVIRVGATRIGPERLVSGLEAIAKVAKRRVKLLEFSVSEIVNRQTGAFRPGTTGCKVEVDCHFQMR
jgi:hypothetical protein